MSSRNRGNPPSYRQRQETELIRKRDKQHDHDQYWDNQKQYYEHWTKTNRKFDDWTSPRYHETQTLKVAQMQNGREREQKLEKRRDKLRQLMYDDEQLYRIEMMAKKQVKGTKPRYGAVVPTEVLKELNLGLQLEEEDRRRHQAEIGLYHQWRESNPILAHYERMHKGRALKLSWLDQQIERRMRKEKEEEECRRTLKERDLLLKHQRERDEKIKAELETKRQQLKIGLSQQIEALKQKARDSEELARKEQLERNEITKLEQLQEEWKLTQRKIREKECVLHNIKEAKYKLKKKAELIQANLDEEKAYLERIKQSELAERIEDATKREEIQTSIVQFLQINREQKQLEKLREKHLNLLFDSEAKYEFEKQSFLWQEEENARANLMRNIVETIGVQIGEKLAKNKQMQVDLVREREEMMGRIEECNREMEELAREEVRKKRDLVNGLDEGVKVKEIVRKEQENDEERRIDVELERVRKEEERIKREIMNIQKRQGPIRPTRSRIFF